MREPCSGAVPEVPKGSYHRDRPWFCPLLPALLLPGQVGPVPKLLLALVQGMGPNHPHVGVKCLGGAAASFPPFPSFLSLSPCWRLQTVPSSPCPTALFLWSLKQLSREVHARGGVCLDLFGATFSLPHTRSGDAQAGIGSQQVYGLSALCIPGILPLGPYGFWCEPLHTSVPQFPH